MKRVMALILALVMAVALGACAAPQTENEKVTLVLDWTPNTNHTGLYVALENGYFTDNGLDVEIIQPSEGSVVQLVAAGSAQFGIDFQEATTFARDKGIPVVSIAAILQHNTSAFAAPVDRGITSAKDFEGKTYGGWGMDMETATIKYMMAQQGADIANVNIVSMGDTDAITAFDMSSIDFAWIYEGWEGINAQMQGIELSYVPFADDPVFDYYTPIIITSEDMISSNKETVSKFMDAVAKGYTYAAENPDKSADILLKHAPELDADLVHASQEFLSPKYIDDAASFGVQKQEVWDRYTQWLSDQGFLETQVDSTMAFTNEFVQ
jgi:ABC-type nitrate/sulfonate/bicarbonate transport system substrate-binding protein